MVKAQVFLEEISPMSRAVASVFGHLLDEDCAFGQNKDLRRECLDLSQHTR
jgi:hypothetical protein